MRAEGAPRLPFDPERSARRRRRLRDAAGAAAPRETAALVAAATSCAARASCPRVEPQLDARRACARRARATNVRPQQQPGFAVATVTVPLGDVTGAQLARPRRPGASLTATATLRVTPRAEPAPALGARRRRSRRCTARLAAAGLGVAGRGHDRRRHELPGRRGLPARGHAVARRSRALARRAPARAARSSWPPRAGPRPSRSAAARTAAASTTSPAIGFQGSVRKLGGRAVPQYFVLVGGGVGDGAARLRPLAAKVPARRIPEAVERLVALYLRERRPGEDGGRVLRARGRARQGDARAARGAPARGRGAGRLRRAGRERGFQPPPRRRECAAKGPRPAAGEPPVPLKRSPSVIRLTGSPPLRRIRLSRGPSAMQRARGDLRRIAAT